MLAVKNFFNSSSSSSSSSLRNSPRKKDCDISDDDDDSRKRKLTRQRRLRHVTAAMLGLGTSDPPKPMPLPEYRICVKESDDHHHNSCLQGSSREEGDGSCVSPQAINKAKSDPTTNSDNSPTHSHKGSPLRLDSENSDHNFNLEFPARSAPTSPYASPVRSPRRFKTVDFVPSSSSSIPQLLFSSARTENALSDSGNRRFSTPDNSPLHSPKQKSNVRNINHHNVHPLPLPPSPKPTRSITTTYTSEKHEFKSQWVKGKLIGSGAYGSVYEAVNSDNGAMCAMKEVNFMLDDAKSVECIKQLEQEIKILQHLEHKNIVRYYGCEVVEDRFCIHLEYVYPGSINKYVQDRFGAITESVVRNFTRHILSGLAYLHNTNTIHRDIKGANLLVDSSGVVKLADFGLAKHLTAAATDLSLKGSPHWMAPEVLQAVMRKDSNDQHAYAIDIWSLGCTVIEMFTGKPPWSEFTWAQALFQVMHKSPDIPDTLSSEGKEFLRLCFQRNPANRPSAAQLLDHAFVRSTQKHGVSICRSEFSGFNSAEASSCPIDRPNIYRSLPTSPCARVKQLQGKGWTPQRSNRASSSKGPAIHYSPHSTLEALPSSMSSPEPKSNLYGFNQFTRSSHHLQFATRGSYQNITRKDRKGFSRSFDIGF